MPLLKTFIFSLCIFAGALQATDLTPQSTSSREYATETGYTFTGQGTYVHLAIYPNFRIITDMSDDNFGSQIIEDYEGNIIFEAFSRSDMPYSTFFILVNYYDTFEVVTISSWFFNGIYQMASVNKQYIQYYEE